VATVRLNRSTLPLCQQYLTKNPFGYRCHANTDVKFPT